MDSLTHFHSKNIYFYIHFSYSFKVKALSLIFQNFWFDTNLNIKDCNESVSEQVLFSYTNFSDVGARVKSSVPPDVHAVQLDVIACYRFFDRCKKTYLVGSARCMSKVVNNS